MRTITTLALLLVISCGDDAQLYIVEEVPTDRSAPTATPVYTPVDNPDQGIVSETPKPIPTIQVAREPDAPSGIPFDLDSCPDYFNYNTGNFGDNRYQDVAGFPFVNVISQSPQQVSPGDEVNLTFTVTAVCGPIRIRVINMLVNQNGPTRWLEQVQDLNQPMYFESIGQGIIDELYGMIVTTSPHGCLNYIASHIWGRSPNWSALELDAFESETFRLHFTATDLAPHGDPQHIALDGLNWEDLSTSQSIQTTFFHYPVEDQSSTYPNGNSNTFVVN